jgi:hypothetical protein
MKQRALIGLAMIIGLGIPLAGRAQDASSPDGQPGLKIAPTRYEETVAAGKPKDGTIDVFNVSKQPLTVQADVENIRMVGENGELEFYTGDNPYRLHNFVKLDTAPFTLGVGEARRVKFRLEVPAGVFPGGYFGSILFRIVPPPGGPDATTILQSGEVGTLLILTVEGDTARTGRIEQLAVTRNDVADRRRFKITYRNTGSETTRPLGLAYRPSGTLVIKNMLGITVARRQVNGELVLPGAARNFDVNLSKAIWFGRYTAELQLAPGSGQPAERRRIAYWSFSPLGLLLAGLFAGTVLAALLIRRRRGWRSNVQRTSLLDEVAAEKDDRTKRP